MPDPTPVDPAPILGRAAVAADETLADLARALGYSDNSVRRAMARYSPVRETLATVKREVGIAAWQSLQFKALAAADEILDGAKERGFAKDVQGLAITAGIATEKAQLLQGLPTSITAQTHEARLALPERVALLAQLAERMARLAGASAAGTPALAQESGSAGPIIEAESRAVR